MKKSIGVLLLIFILTAVTVTVMAGAPPPPPPNPTGPPSGGTWIGGAPTANGLFILIALGMSYGARKLYNARKRKISE